jgi:hypothetical protein
MFLLRQRLQKILETNRISKLLNVKCLAAVQILKQKEAAVGGLKIS